MALGRPPLGKRALLAATLGAIYGLLLLPAPETVLGVSVFGVAWFLLSVGLLFLTTLAYHAFTLFSLLWMVWQTIQQVQEPSSWLVFGVDIAFPLAALTLLVMSPYKHRARAFEESSRAADEDDDAPQAP